MGDEVAQALFRLLDHWAMGGNEGAKIELAHTFEGREVVAHVPGVVWIDQDCSDSRDQISDMGRAGWKIDKHQMARGVPRREDCTDSVVAIEDNFVAIFEQVIDWEVDP